MRYTCWTSQVLAFFCFLLHHIKNETKNKQKQQKQLNRWEEDQVKFCGRSCSMKGNLSTAAQMGPWEELFRGSCPSPQATARLHDECWVGTGYRLGKHHLGEGSSSKAETNAKDKRKTSVHHLFCCTNYGLPMRQFANNQADNGLRLIKYRYKPVMFHYQYDQLNDQPSYTCNTCVVFVWCFAEF